MAKTCNYYVTLRCNDTCEFCTFWQKPSVIEEKPFDLSILKPKGVKILNITGGEPLLREDLPQILKNARELEFWIELTTNGIVYAERARELEGLVNRMFFSLDYPIASEHDRSRGVECFHTVIQGIERAKELGEKPIINFTLTRDSVRYLPEMIELAEKLKTPVYLNPVYDFFGTQGFERETFEYIRYYRRRKNVLINWAVIEFVKAGGNNILLPRCRAKETTVTLMPDGSWVFPCFFNPDGNQGKDPVCLSCMRWPYMIPSFTVGFDKYFWLNLWSNFLNGRKKL